MDVLYESPYLTHHGCNHSVTTLYYATEYSPYLAHHGIKNQKWGIRRFQNPDGTLTALGKARARALRSKEYVSNRIKQHDEKQFAKAKSGANYKLIKKYSPRMTDQELKTAVDRYSTLNRIAPVKPVKPVKIKARRKSFLEKTADVVTSYANISKGVSDIVSNVNKIQNRGKDDDGKGGKNDAYKSYMKMVNEQANKVYNDTYKNTEGSASDRAAVAANAYKSYVDLAVKGYKGEIKVSSEKKDSSSSSKPKSSVFAKLAKRMREKKVDDLSDKYSYLDDWDDLGQSSLKTKVNDIDLSDKYSYLDDWDDLGHSTPKKKKVKRSPGWSSSFHNWGY